MAALWSHLLKTSMRLGGVQYRWSDFFFPVFSCICCNNHHILGASCFSRLPLFAANQNVCHERTRAGKVSTNEGTRHDNSNCFQQIQVKMFFCFYNEVMFFVFYNKVMEFNSRWLSTPSCWSLEWLAFHPSHLILTEGWSWTYFKLTHRLRRKLTYFSFARQMHGDGGQPACGRDDARSRRRVQGWQGLWARSHHVRGEENNL